MGLPQFNESFDPEDTAGHRYVWSRLTSDNLQPSQSVVDNPRVMAAGFSIVVGAIAILFSMTACGPKTAVDLSSDLGGDSPYPGFRSGDVQGEKNFASLMNNYTQGKIVPTPWAGHWWPYTANGIAAGSSGGGGGYSPAGKYDAARGGTTQSQSWEVRHHGAGVPKIQSWWGHCNGWCAAAALHPEPLWNATVNGIQFGIGDIKALLSEAGMAASADYYGERIDTDDGASPKYWDTVPDQYFLVLTNYIGKLKQAVLIDRYTGSQVWNQPLAAYRFEYPKKEDVLEPDPAAPNVSRVMVTSTLWWVEDGVPPDVQTPPFDWENSDPAIFTARTLKMEVWLDGPVVWGDDGKIKSSGNVIVSRQGDYIAGGAWRVGDGFYVDGWPDYMWVPYSLFRPDDPDQDYANPSVDINWLKAHLMTPGGTDDSSVTPRPIETAPAPRPSANPSSSPGPSPVPPSSEPGSFPGAWPTSWPSGPDPTSTPGPGPMPPPPPETPEPEPER